MTNSNGNDSKIPEGDANEDLKDTGKDEQMMMHEEIEKDILRKDDKFEKRADSSRAGSRAEVLHKEASDKPSRTSTNEIENIYTMNESTYTSLQTEGEVEGKKIIKKKH